MNTKAVAGVVIAVVIVGVAGFLLVFNPLQGNLNFHIEKQITSDVTAFELILSDLEDTNLSISFVDDETLLYSIDIALYETTLQENAFTLNTEWTHFHSLTALTRIRSMNVTLGTGVPYTLTVDGSDLSSSITYDNGALINNTSGVGGVVWYEASGTFLFTLTENVAMSTDFDLTARGSSLSHLSALYLDIDLQTGVGGELQIGSIPISFVDRVGWTWDGFGTYETAAGSPTVDVVVSWCDQIYANLLD